MIQQARQKRQAMGFGPLCHMFGFLSWIECELLTSIAHYAFIQSARLTRLRSRNSWKKAKACFDL